MLSASVPETDSMKYFVGQVPRAFGEEHLKPIFEEFGPVYQLNVLRDKATNQSKGCCFVTFYKKQDGMDASDTLHNLRTLPGMNHPIQMKPADTERRNVEERKLFVGMLSKKFTEDDVKLMFSPYGQIEECTVLRDASGSSRGCAFVTYSSKGSAGNAMKTLDQSSVMEGCSSALKVRIADTQKEKESKRQQKEHQAITLTNLVAPPTAMYGTTAALPTAAAMSQVPQNLYSTHQYMQLLQHQLHQPNIGTFGLTPTAATDPLQSYANFGIMPQAYGALAGQQAAGMGMGMQGLYMSGMPGASVSPGPSASPLSVSTAYGVNGANTISPMTANGVGNAVYPFGSAATTAFPQLINQGQLMGQGQPLVTAGSPTSASTVLMPVHQSNSNGTSPSPHSTNAVDTMTQAYTGLQQYAAAVAQAASLRAGDTPAGKQSEGPDGANLFIYHLPQEVTDESLCHMFQGFGKILSAKVYIDQNTQLSKCFGFVSYDTSQAANAAISAMNGFQVGMKRLKVQLKKPKDKRKPY